MADTLEVFDSASPEHALKAGVLGLFDSVIMGIAGVAPAYSIAASTGALIAAVALGGAAALLYCGIAMFGIVFAFSYLGQVETNSGAAYSWVRRALHPLLGFMSGWALIVSALIFMVIATVPAGANVLGLFSTAAANNKIDVTLVGCVFFLSMVCAVAAGVTITVTVQVVMSCIELALLVLFAFLAIFHAQHIHAFTWHWFSPGIFHGQNGFIAGALVAAFYYWGWDVTANLNEETKGAKKTPGLGAIIGILVVFVLFEVFTIATNMVLTTGQINHNEADVLSVLGQEVWRGTGGKFIVLAVVLSTIATLETTLIQVTRTMFSMGRDNTLPKLFGTVNQKRKTPIFATAVVCGISLLLFVFGQFIGSVSQILTDGIDAIGLQIAIYYCLAGIAVVVLFRRELLKSVTNFFFMGLWPLIGACFMGYMFYKSIPNLWDSDPATVYIGLGAMALGLIPMFIYWAKGVPYFKRPEKEDRVAVIQEFEQNL